MAEHSSISSPKHWDLSNTDFETLLSLETLIFLGKVLVAASIVAFGPALVLEYVPAKKVDVGDVVDAASPAGRTQRLLLAFAGGGLMAEAALHLLPHLFAHHHSHDEDDHHGHGYAHLHGQGPLDTFSLIALGFLVTFAIDRFAGKKAKDTVSSTKSTKSSAKDAAVKTKEVESPPREVPTVPKEVETDTAADIDAATLASCPANEKEVEPAAATTKDKKPVEEMRAPASDAELPPVPAIDATASTDTTSEVPIESPVDATEETPDSSQAETATSPDTAVEDPEPEARTSTSPEAAPENGSDAVQHEESNEPDVDATTAEAADREAAAESTSAASVTEADTRDAQTAADAETQPADEAPAQAEAEEEEEARAEGEAETEAETTKGDNEETPAEPIPDTSSTVAAAEDGATQQAEEAEASEDAPSQPATSASAASKPEADEEKPAEPELTLYGNPRTPIETETPMGEAIVAEEKSGDELQDDTAAEIEDNIAKEHHEAEHEEGADAHGKHHGHGDHHHHDHGDPEGGAYATLAVDVLHNVIDGIGIGAAYTLGGNFAGHMTALLKLIHEIQHEIGDVATLVQHGMSKHHAIHIQHSTAAGVFLGVAISLGTGVFPSGVLSALLALSAGATFHLASGTILGPVLAIPPGVGGSDHALLELVAVVTGAGGVVAIGFAEKLAGLGH